MTDTSTIPAPKSYGRTRPKVPAFARYVGTSAWRSNKRRVREYYAHLAAQKMAGHAPTA